MEIKVCLTVSGSIKSPKRVTYKWNSIRLLECPRSHKYYGNASRSYIIRTLSDCLYLNGNRDLYLHLLMFTKQAAIYSSCLLKGRLIT